MPSTPSGNRSYRFQWSADLMTSSAFEMENVILAWFIAVQTGSVLLVVVFGSLQYLGTLVAPVLGLAGDHVGHRLVMVGMRLAFVLLAALLAVLVLLDALTPAAVLVVAGIAGLIRPSDISLRTVLIGETVPEARLMGAISLSRITMDGARLGGALAGAGVVAVLGMGRAYAAIVLLYLAGAALTLGVARQPPRPRSAARSPLHDLLVAARAVWQAPPQLAAMVLAFAVNLTAYPFTLGLLPFIAREVYGTTQEGLGTLVAATGAGSIAASLLLGVVGTPARPGRTMLVWSVVWHGLLILFGQLGTMTAGLVLLPLIGAAQMMCLLPVSVLLVRGAPPELRGRIMGMRTLAIYGLPIGLLCAGPLIDHLGFPGTAWLYGLLGSAATLVVGIAWRAHL